MKKIDKFVIAHIDDDPLVLDMVKLALEQNRYYAVRSYNTAEEFLGRESRDKKPDLIILDYFLNSKVPSAMSGSELVEIFRGQENRIPIIIISSQKKVSVALDLVKLEVVDYIEKTEDFVSKIGGAVANVINMKKVEFEKKKISYIIKKDKEHLFMLLILLIAGMSVFYLLYDIFL